MTIDLIAATRIAPFTALTLAAVVALGGCSGIMNTPTAQSVAGLSPFTARLDRGSAVT